MKDFDDKDINSEVYTIRDLSFSYGDKKIFDNINYTFIRNKKYLIIGDSGIGKSTLLKLMFGYITNYKGDIYFNKELISENNYINIKNHVLYINQEPYLFNDTIRNNIYLNNSYEDEKILNILNELGLHLTIKDLDINVGDREMNISGGQRQRIVLARGLIRNQKIIFIDEGTSAVDKITSIQIEKMLLSRKDLTVIVVTHNINEETRDLFDQILFFSESFK